MQKPKLPESFSEDIARFPGAFYAAIGRDHLADIRRFGLYAQKGLLRGIATFGDQPSLPESVTWITRFLVTRCGQHAVTLMSLEGAPLAISSNFVAKRLGLALAAFGNEGSDTARQFVEPPHQENFYVIVEPVRGSEDDLWHGPAADILDFRKEHDGRHHVRFMDSLETRGTEMLFRALHARRSRYAA